MHDTAARGQFDRSGAVVGSEGISVGEATDVAGITDELCGDDLRYSPHLPSCN